MTLYFVNHRVNYSKLLPMDQRLGKSGTLAQVLPGNGVELDIRWYNGVLCLTHDNLHAPAGLPAGRVVESFDDFLKVWADGTPRGPLFVNIKEQGTYQPALKLLADYSVTNFVFLDAVQPDAEAISLSHGRVAGYYGVTGDNFSERFSRAIPGFADYAGFADFHKGRVGWMWVDCWEGVLALNADIYRTFTDAGMQVIIVSPELQPVEGVVQNTLLVKIPAFQDILETCAGDVWVCTKRPDLWGQETPADVVALLEESFAQ